jgi:hypothetical protein
LLFHGYRLHWQRLGVHVWRIDDHWLIGSHIRKLIFGNRESWLCWDFSRACFLDHTASFISWLAHYLV